MLDSTISPVYCKKCSEKPSASNIKIRTLSRSNIFPFKHSFSVTEDIPFTTSLIPLKGWYSFIFNSVLFSKKPNFDFYFDFKSSDIYNHLFSFNKPVEILNVSAFTKSIQNNYFELSSNFVKQNESTYLLNVIVKVKQSVLPEKEGQLLVEFTEALDYLNNLSILYK